MSYYKQILFAINVSLKTFILLSKILILFFFSFQVSFVHEENQYQASKPKGFFLSAPGIACVSFIRHD